jgi:hypothetical protein
MAGKVKVTKSLLNIVTLEEPKRLRGSNQNGNAPVTPVAKSGYADRKVHGGEARPNPAERDSSATR